jgi:hypothetical protein
MPDKLLENEMVRLPSRAIDQTPLLILKPGKN